MKLSTTIYIFPTRLKKAIITPIYKKDDPEIAKKDRPISITVALSKFFENLLYKQIKEYLLSNNLISNTQFGFRILYSTMDAILFYVHWVLPQISGRKQIRYRNSIRSIKSFQFYHHEHLKTKLNELGFSDSAIEMIHSFIINREKKLY